MCVCVLWLNAFQGTVLLLDDTSLPSVLEVGLFLRNRGWLRKPWMIMPVWVTTTWLVGAAEAKLKDTAPSPGCLIWSPHGWSLVADKSLGANLWPPADGLLCRSILPSCTPGSSSFTSCLAWDSYTPPLSSSIWLIRYQQCCGGVWNPDSPPPMPEYPWATQQPILHMSCTQSIVRYAFEERVGVQCILLVFKLLPAITQLNKQKSRSTNNDPSMTIPEPEPHPLDLWKGHQPRKPWRAPP